MVEDHLDRETSVSVKITDSGITAGAKSRFIAAIDRLGGSLLDAASAHVEAHTDKRRAKTKGEVTLIDAISQSAIDYVGADPKLLERAINRHFRKVLAQQENADGVLNAALNDLRESPPTDASAANDASLSEEFLDRFEKYSETASTDELRQRWGRVLATEVRKPGTFSGKVLRVVDELDGDTALIFQELCKHRVGKLLPLALIGEVPFDVKSKLITADLIIDPGSSTQFNYFGPSVDSSGVKMFIAGQPDVGGVAIPDDGTNYNAVETILIKENESYGLPSLLLTPAGAAISSILPDQQLIALEKYGEILKQKIGVSWVRIYKPVNGQLLIHKTL